MEQDLQGGAGQGLHREDAPQGDNNIPQVHPGDGERLGGPGERREPGERGEWGAGGGGAGGQLGGGGGGGGAGVGAILEGGHEQRGRGGGGNIEPQILPILLHRGGIRRAPEPVGPGLDPACKKAKLVQVPFQQIMEEFFDGPDAFHQEKYSYEEVQTMYVSSLDNFELCIRDYAKIALDPRIEYSLDVAVNIRTTCYIIGNGATIKINCREHIAFMVHPKAFGPAVVNMWGMTFVNCKFERGSGFNGTVFKSNTFITFQDCQFLGFTGTAVEVTSGADIRGCYFLACYRAILNSGRISINVLSCHLDKCILGIMSNADANVKRCFSSETFCFLMLRGCGHIKNNVIHYPYKITDKSSFVMVTCAGGRVVPLAAFHIVSNKKKHWPLIYGNTFTKSRIFLGNRKGVIHMQQCMFNYSQICADKEASKKIVLQESYNGSLNVVKILRTDPGDLSSKICVCGTTHLLEQHMVGDITCEVLPDAEVNAVDAVDYSSGDDD